MVADGRIRVNSVPDDKLLEWSKLKASADDKISVNLKTEFYFGMSRKHCGKGESAGYQHFLLFPQCFQKPSFSALLNVSIVW